MSFLPGYAQDVGSRDRQEDYLAEKQIGNMHVAILADGMGGYEGGDQASDIVTQGFIRFVEQQAQRYPQIPDLLVDATFSANARLAQIKKNANSNMGSTLVASLVRGNHAWWVSVGDSLLYLWRNDQLQKLNAKHSHYQDLRQKVFLGEMSSAQVASDPQRDGLTSALTGREIKYVDVSRFGIDLQQGDIFILASDGLETLSTEQIIAILQKNSTPQQIADILVRHVKLAGNPHQDNVSVLVVGANIQQGVDPRNRIVTRVKKNRFASPFILPIGGLLVGGMLGFAAAKIQSKPMEQQDTPSIPRNLPASSDLPKRCIDEVKRAGEVCQQVFAKYKRSLDFCPKIEEETKKRCESSQVQPLLGQKSPAQQPPALQPPAPQPPAPQPPAPQPPVPQPPAPQPPAPQPPAPQPQTQLVPNPEPSHPIQQTTTQQPLSPVTPQPSNRTGNYQGRFE